MNLTPSEREVLTLLAQGLTNSQIAEATGRTEGGIKQTARNINRALGIQTTSSVKMPNRAEVYKKYVEDDGE